MVQVASEQRPHKLSYNLQTDQASAAQVIKRLQTALDDCKGLKAQVRMKRHLSWLQQIQIPHVLI